MRPKKRNHKHVDTTDVRLPIEYEEMLRTIIEHSNEVFYFHDTDHRLHYVSPRSIDILGYAPEEMMVKWTSLTTDNPINDAGFRLTNEAIKSGKRQPPYTLEVRRKDGGIRLVQVNESPVKDESGQVVGIAGALRDITESERLQSRLAEISANEREKLRRDLHDTVCQRLAGAGLLADHLREDLADFPGRLAERVDEISRLVRQSLDEAQLLGGKMERLPDTPGALGEALEDLASRIANLYDVRCRVTSPKRVSLGDGLTGSQLLLIAQEAATNAARHAGASRIGISLSQRGRVIELRVRDDGKSVTKKKGERVGTGIKIMHERADLIGGKLAIHHPAEGGTVVECTWEPGTGTVRD